MMTATEKKFYNLFWTDPICQSIFSIHKGQLLEDEVELIVSKEKYYAQRLVLTNSQKRKTGTQIAKRTENENIELVTNLQNAAKKYFNEERIESFVKQKFGRTIKKVETDFRKSGSLFKLIVKLVSSLDDEKDLFKLLSDYYLIPKEIENLEQFAKYFEQKFSIQVKEFLKKENLYDLALSIDLISTYYNYKIKDNLLSATKHYTEILYDNENYKDRIDFFDSLYEMKILKGGKLKSYYECVNCSPNTYNGILTTDIKPSRLKLKCPSCGKELFYIVPYELDDVIYKHIIHKDGILFFAIQFLLEEYGYSFKQNQTFLKDVEVDFCLVGENQNIVELIEVKMFKTDRPSDTQVGNIRESVKQMKDIIDKLSKDELGYRKIKHSIVTNIIDENVYNEANKQLAMDLKDYKISIYSMTDFLTKIKK